MTASRQEFENYYRNNFVELIDPLNRLTGRKLYVHKLQHTKLKDLLEQRDKNHNYLYIYRQIVSLKNEGFWNSFRHKFGFFSRTLPLEGGKIVYAALNGKIYIESVDIQLNYTVEKNKRTVAAGTYKAKAKFKKDGEKTWSVGETSRSATSIDTINTKNLAINGHCKDINEAANYMPAFIRHSFGDTELRDVYTLFFNPSQGFASGDLMAMRDSLGIATTKASKKLTATLISLSQKGNKVNLTVHESAHALLKESLRQLVAEGVQCPNMTVAYANPTHNLSLVDIWRRQAGMNLLKGKPPLCNNFSPMQYVTSGNFISNFEISARSDPKNMFGNSFNEVGNSLGAYAFAKGAGALFGGLAGAAGWCLAAAPFLLSSNRDVNKKVITGGGKAVQEGAKQLIWDPVHKIMVRE